MDFFFYSKRIKESSEYVSGEIKTYLSQECEWIMRPSLNKEYAFTSYVIKEHNINVHNFFHNY